MDFLQTPPPSSLPGMRFGGHMISQRSLQQGAISLFFLIVFVEVGDYWLKETLKTL